MTTEGAFRLATAILLDAYDSYTKSLKTIKELSDFVEKNEEIYSIWKSYKELEKEYKRKKITGDKRKEFFKLKKYLSKKKYFKKAKETDKKMNDYFEATIEKQKCEFFYNSQHYVILTLGKGVPGEEVMKHAKAKVGYEYE